MKSELSVYSLAAGAVLAVAALGVSTVAKADNLFWSIGVSSPGVQFDVSNAQPAYGQPVYTQPYYAPQVYSQPQVVYQQPQVIYQQPQVVYQQPQVIYQQPRHYYAPPPVVYLQPRPVYIQPRPVHLHPRPVYVQPQTEYGRPHGGHHNRPAAVVNTPRPANHGWQHPGEDHRPYDPSIRPHGRVAGAWQSNDGGRNHH